MLLFPPTKSTIFLKIIFEYYENKITFFSFFNKFVELGARLVLQLYHKLTHKILIH